MPNKTMSADSSHLLEEHTHFVLVNQLLIALSYRGAGEKRMIKVRQESLS